MFVAGMVDVNHGSSNEDRSDIHRVIVAIQFLVWKINCCQGLIANDMQLTTDVSQDFSIKASLVSPYFVACLPSGTRKKNRSPSHCQGLENMFNLQRDEVAKVTSKIIQQRFLGMFRIHSKIWLPLT